MFELSDPTDFHRWANTFAAISAFLAIMILALWCLHLQSTLNQILPLPPRPGDKLLNGERPVEKPDEPVTTEAKLARDRREAQAHKERQHKAA